MSNLANAQLAITEVLSNPSSTPAQHGSDYWELTNFGKTPIALDNYFFSDSGGFGAAINIGYLLENPTIAPEESIVFVRSESERLVTLITPIDFRRWWGDSNFQENSRIVVSPWDFGFSAEADSVILWQDNAGQILRVDQVALPESEYGEAFTYDQSTGLLNITSKFGVNGAFQAATTTDVGSPGQTIGPVPLRVIQAPGDLEVDGGARMLMSVRAVGLPRPVYQWRFNGQPIPGATSTELIIPNVGNENAEEYAVEISNGLTNFITPSAIVVVNSNPSCAAIVKPPLNIEVTPGQTAIFTVEVRGFPLPTMRWQFNGADIRGETNTTLQIKNVQSNLMGVYTVHVSNASCSTNATAQLDVRPIPRLAVTEAMAFPSTNSVGVHHDDWWELTNMDTYPVNIKGYRFDDKPGELHGAVTVLDEIVLQPGQSMIWVSSMSPAEFRRWWGEQRLPDGLPIISYPGNGFSATSGDMIRLWNATALVREDFVTSLSFVNNEQGISRWSDGSEDCELCHLSREGENGAFRAAESDDIGSPGWTGNEQSLRPSIVSLNLHSTFLELTWTTQPGRYYEIQTSPSLTSPDWRPLTTVLATETISGIQTPKTAAPTRAFYRILHLPASP